MTPVSTQFDPASAFAGRRVLVTGHTGFKGSWLSLWLAQAGALVTGLALDPPTDPSMFEACQLEDLMDSNIGDIRDLETVRGVLGSSRPEVVFHLAAQPIVRLGYQEPVDTYSTNVMGTVHVVEACRNEPSVKAVVVVTSDKCYENLEHGMPYRETDTLGGHDPYSSSKACAEIVASAYARSYFGAASHEQADVRLATARAGNVIGGGDWAADRLLPDAARALSANQQVMVRNPDAVRPWQHVLEPLSGYLLLAQHLLKDDAGFGGAWNFGPDSDGITRVREVMDRFCEAWGGGCWEVVRLSGPQPREATLLTLDSSKARDLLGWKPVLELDEALDMTAHWYAAYTPGADMRELTIGQIRAYTERAGAGGR